MESLKKFFCVEPKDISYLRWIIESYDGIAFLKTVNPDQAIVALEISPGCENCVNELLSSLRVQEKLSLDELDQRIY
jgi:hypothetical protein